MGSRSKVTGDEKVTSEGDPGITVRRMTFSFPAELDPMIVEGAPEESYLYVALSLLLPYLEPYLIRSMREARPRVTDPALAIALDRFNAQEGQHYRQHLRFNAAIRRSGCEALAPLEAALEADYQRFTKTRSLRWNLAYAEGFEAFTSAMARFTFEQGLLDRVRPGPRELFEWHLVEELEHRTVAFDVYEHVCGGWIYRLIVGLYAQWHLNLFLRRAAVVLASADPVAFQRTYGGLRRTLARVGPLLRLSARFLFPRILATYLPWYTPHAIALPARTRAIADRYTALAESAARVAPVAPAPRA